MDGKSGAGSNWLTKSWKSCYVKSLLLLSNKYLQICQQIKNRWIMMALKLKTNQGKRHRLKLGLSHFLKKTLNLKHEEHKVRESASKSMRTSTFIWLTISSIHTLNYSNNYIAEIVEGIFAKINVIFHNEALPKTRRCLGGLTLLLVNNYWTDRDLKPFHAYLKRLRFDLKRHKGQHGTKLINDIRED